MRNLRSLVLLLCFWSVQTFSQWQSVGDVDSLRQGSGSDLFVFAGPSTLNVTVLAPDLIRVRLATAGMFLPDSSWAVIKHSWAKPVVSITDLTDEIRLSTSEVTLTIRKHPMRLSFYETGGGLINEDEPARGMSWNGSEVRAWKSMPLSEHYYGFGEKAGSLDRRERAMTMWNSDIPGYKADTDPLYQSIPLFYGINQGKAYAIFLDNTYRSSFDMGKESRDTYSFGVEDGELNYYFFYGPSPAKIIRRYTELIGRMPMPPRWSLGYQQCRWSYAPESRVREIAKGFRERKIPCDVLYLDIDYMDGYRIFTWSPKNFPRPKEMIRDLANEGFKVAVIVDPGIKQDSSYTAFQSGLAGNHFVRYPGGQLYIGKVWPGECAFPDFTSDAARVWWGDQFSVLVDAGVRGWWNDMNEPSVFDVATKTIDLDVVHNDDGLAGTHAKDHNVYGMEMTRATYEGVRKLLPDERPFVLTRASYAGGQRYSSAWTGDNISTWEHLEMAVPMCLNLSISGQPFVGTDIGGFIGHPSGELFARWLQLGVFTPLMRAHSVINEPNKEPWEYGDEFTAINRKTIELRYKLLPYVYNVMYQASMTGIPAMRPLVFEYPKDESYLHNASEFMFGDGLLVAPVLWEGDTTRSVRLPEGTWYDFWTHAHYDGGKSVTVQAPIDRIPIFVKAGTIIPTQQVVQYTGQEPIDPITLTFYPTEGNSSSSTYYEDDGTSFNYESGGFFRRTYEQRMTQKEITVFASDAEGSYVPQPRTAIVKLVSFTSSPLTTMINGKELLKKETLLQLQQAHAGWFFDKTNRTLYVKFPDGPSAQRIVITK